MKPVSCNTIVEAFLCHFCFLKKNKQSITIQMALISVYKLISELISNHMYFSQVLHFFVGFGALLSPLIADPFLSDTNCIQSNSTLNGSRNLEHIRNSIVSHHPGNVSHYVLPLYGPALTNVGYAFWIMAAINVSKKISCTLYISAKE